MTLKTTSSYVLTGQSPNTFNGDYQTYEAYRNALFKISESAPLFLKELDGSVTTSDLKPHFDSGTSIAIGYGLDLLVRDNDEVNQYFDAAQLSHLTDTDKETLEHLRR